jgi:hypothetical protein
VVAVAVMLAKAGTDPPLPVWGLLAVLFMLLAPRNLFDRGWRLRPRPPRTLGRARRRGPPARLRGRIYRPPGAARGTVVRRARGTIDHPMPERPWLTPGYRAYMAGRITGFDGITWPERMRRFLVEHRRGPARGACELGYLGICEGQAYQGNHLDYSELYRETRRTVQLVCGACHAEYEHAKDRTRGVAW